MDARGAQGWLGAPFALSILMSRTETFFRDKVVLITGASSGIGEELAWQLSQAGAKLTLAARRAELLQALAERIATARKPKPLVVACDVYARRRPRAGRGRNRAPLGEAGCGHRQCGLWRDRAAAKAFARRLPPPVRDQRLRRAAHDLCGASRNREDARQHRDHGKRIGLGQRLPEFRLTP